MKIDRRLIEASRLRDFFQEQITHLSHLLDGQRDGPDTTDDERAIEALVSGTDGRIRSVHRYHKLLRDAVKALLEHIADLTAQLPAPTLFSQKQFGLNPQLASLFVTPLEMQLLFSRNREVQTFFQAHDQARQTEVFTLLSVSKQEKEGFGCRLEGDRIIREVARTTLNFTGHQLAAVCPSEEQLLAMLRKLLFESTVDYLRTHLAKRKLNYYRTADREARLPSPQENLNNPAVYLQTLVKLLEEPIALIRVERNLLHVDRLGVLQPQNDPASANEMELNELQVGDWSNRAIFLARYPRAESLSHEQLTKEFNTLIF